MKLWLDDLRPAPEGWTWVKTAWDAIDLLGRGGVAEVSLDHDIGEPGHGTGYDVTKFIEAEAFHGRLGRLAWRVHGERGRLLWRSNASRGRRRSQSAGDSITSTGDRCHTRARSSR